MTSSNLCLRLFFLVLQTAVPSPLSSWFNCLVFLFFVLRNASSLQAGLAIYWYRSHKTTVSPRYENPGSLDLPGGIALDRLSLANNCVGVVPANTCSLYWFCSLTSIWVAQWSSSQQAKHAVCVQPGVCKINSVNCSLQKDLEATYQNVEQAV